MDPGQKQEPVIRTGPLLRQAACYRRRRETDVPSAERQVSVPRGGGPARGQFARWFGDTEDFELTEAALGEVGGRPHLRWRPRLRAERLGGGWFTVEQQAYADAGQDGRLARLDLVCTGYRAEGGDG